MGANHQLPPIATLYHIMTMIVPGFIGAQALLVVKHNQKALEVMKSSSVASKLLISTVSIISHYFQKHLSFDQILILQIKFVASKFCKFEGV